MFMKVEIVKLDDFGRGICFINDKVTFVPNTVPGDIANIKVIKETPNNLFNIKITNDGSISINSSKNIFEMINSRRGNELTVKDLLDYKDGAFPGGTTKFEKRKISEDIPVWNKEKCIK